MHILLTNDDGYDAAGLAALYGAIDPSDTISVVAPARERSSCGHAATLSGDITVHQVEHQVVGKVFAVDGTPVDCVRLALSELLDTPVDWVISGINAGANVSIVDLNSSGTVSAAREAAFSGLPAIAVSQMYRKEHDVDWSMATRVLRGLLPQLLHQVHRRVKLWNINLPALPPGRPPSAVRVVPLSTDPIPLVYVSHAGRQRGARAYKYCGYYESRTVSPGTDIAAVFADEVSITPIDIDPTDSSALGNTFDLRL